MLQRMNELCVQAANGTNSVSDRQYTQDELHQLISEINRVAETTKFNETYLLKGDMMELYRTCPHSGRRKADNEVVLQIKREIVNIFQDLCKNDEMAEDCAIVYLYGLKLFAGGLSQEMYYSMIGELKDELLVMRKMVLKFEQLKEEAIENINYDKNKSEFMDNSKKALEKMLRTLITQQ